MACLDANTLAVALLVALCSNVCLLSLVLVNVSRSDVFSFSAGCSRGDERNFDSPFVTRVETSAFSSEGFNARSNIGDNVLSNGETFQNDLLFASDATKGDDRKIRILTFEKPSYRYEHGGKETLANFVRAFRAQNAADLGRSENTHSDQPSRVGLARVQDNWQNHARSRRSAGEVSDEAIRRSDVMPDAYLNKAVMKHESEEPGHTKHNLHEILSTITEVERKKMKPGVNNVLLPALIAFEGMVIREIEGINAAAVSQDFRLERLEQFRIELEERLAKASSENVELGGHVALDELATGDNLSNDDLLPADSTGTEETNTLSEDEGSGEAELNVTFTTAATTTSQSNSGVMQSIYDLYREITSVEQKVLAMENFYTVAESELSRTRSEVIKMDDKVTELERVQRNGMVRTTMYGFKLTELENYMGRSEVEIQSLKSSMHRADGRLDYFKDRLVEYKNDLHEVTSQFSRQEQISNELRSADAYKAHDILELRKSLLGMEGRLNGVYATLDHHVSSVRADLRVVIDHLCENNDLLC